jgi:hypothetical protein
MFPDTTEPTAIVHYYTYLNAKFFPIDVPIKTVVMYHYRKLNHYASMDG